MIGVYLVRRGLLTKDQFFAICEEQDRRTPAVGRLALESRVLSMAEVMNVLSEQAVRNQRFGEIAIDLGYITKHGFADLLHMQDVARPSFTDLAVELGFITREKLDETLRAMRKSTRVYARRQRTWFANEPRVDRNGEATQVDWRGGPETLVSEATLERIRAWRSVCP